MKKRELKARIAEQTRISVALGRELDEATARIAELEQERCEAIGAMGDPTATCLIGRCKSIMEQRDEAREERDRLKTRIAEYEADACEGVDECQAQSLEDFVRVNGAMRGNAPERVWCHSDNQWFGEAMPRGDADWRVEYVRADIHIEALDKVLKECGVVYCKDMSPAGVSAALHMAADAKVHEALEAAAERATRALWVEGETKDIVANVHAAILEAKS